MKVSWDDDIPNIWKNKIPVPNHQIVNILYANKHQCRIAREVFGVAEDATPVLGRSKIGFPKSQNPWAL
jgi:hypothetical protein